MIIKEDPLKKKNIVDKDELDQLFKESKKGDFEEILQTLEEYEKDSPKRDKKDSFE